MSALHLTVRSDAVAVLTLDQPGSKANVLTPELVSELETVVDSFAGRTDVRGLVLASAKPGIFIAGADLKLFANVAAPNDPGVRGFIEHGLRVLEKLEGLPFSTCAAIDGAALGGGLEVALALDYRVAGTSSRVQLGLPEVTLGLIPGLGGTQRLSRLIGMDAASEMMASGRSLPADEAVSLKLVDSVADSGSLIETAARLAVSPVNRRLRMRKADPVSIRDQESFAPTLPNGPAAERAVMRVMVEGAALPLKAALAVETEAFMRLVGSEESKYLIGAFFASRKK